MHELAVCQSLLRQLQALAASHAACAVRRVTVQVGTLSGVEPQLLASAFAIARAGSCAEHAELIVETLPVRIGCRRCGAEQHTRPGRLQCGSCGATDTRLLSGDELLLRQVELLFEEVPACATPAAVH